jgi:hypothetical protein
MDAVEYDRALTLINDQNAGLKDKVISLEQQNTKLIEVLEEIRDYEPPHCRGDSNCQLLDIVDNTREVIEQTLAEVKGE